MSTRAAYGFKGDRDEFWVYVHCDGYPSGAAEKFDATLKSKKIWELPRFEADEFAAGFVAANKDGDGNVRLIRSHNQLGWIEYVYVVSQRDGVLWIHAFDADEYPVKPFFSGSLFGFIEKAEELEE